MHETLYEVWHYKISADEEHDEEDLNSKNIGIFSSEDKARSAIEHVIEKEGFRDWRGGFRIFKRWLDHAGWTDGFFNPDDEEELPDVEADAEASRPREPAACSADLQFSGCRCDPDALYSVMGYGMAKAWKKGDHVCRGEFRMAAREKTGFCTYDSWILCESSDINDHVANLLWKCEQNFSELQSIIIRDDLNVSIVCYFEDSIEAATWQMTPENIALSARLCIPIFTAEIRRTSNIVSEIGDVNSATSSSELTSNAGVGQPSRYLET